MIDMNHSMWPPTTTYSKMHVPPCEQVTKEQQAVVERYRKQQAVVGRYRKQQAVVDRYREQQGAKSNSVQRCPELVYSAEQQRALELLENCPVAQRDGYDTVW